MEIKKYLSKLKKCKNKPKKNSLENVNNQNIKEYFSESENRSIKLPIGCYNLAKEIVDFYGKGNGTILSNEEKEKHIRLKKYLSPPITDLIGELNNDPKNEILQDKLFIEACKNYMSLNLMDSRL